MSKIDRVSVELGVAKALPDLKAGDEIEARLAKNCLGLGGPITTTKAVVVSVNELTGSWPGFWKPEEDLYEVVLRDKDGEEHTIRCWEHMTMIF